MEGHALRWPRMLIGAVLLWRTLCVAALGDSPDITGSRLGGDGSSPGLNRSVKLTFANHSASLPDLLSAGVNAHSARQSYPQ